jgi:hypothetical protein
MKFRTVIAAAAVSILALASCSSQADVASYNVSKAADNFEVQRRIVFVNGITDTYLLAIEGRCSIEDEGNQLEVTCKVSEGDREDSFKKHFLGLSDNVTYFVEQTEGVDVDTYRYRVIFRPETIVPDPEIDTSGD